MRPSRARTCSVTKLGPSTAHPEPGVVTTLQTPASRGPPIRVLLAQGLRKPAATSGSVSRRTRRESSAMRLVHCSSRRERKSCCRRSSAKDRGDTKAGLECPTAARLVFATYATRRAVDPSDATAVGLKALLSIHRVYALPLVAGRTRSPALIARPVSSPRSAQTSCSPSARLPTWSTCSSSGPTSPKTCNFAGAGAGKAQIGLAARPASRSYEGTRRQSYGGRSFPGFRQSRDARRGRRSVADADELGAAFCHELGCDAGADSAVTKVLAIA